MIRKSGHRFPKRSCSFKMLEKSVQHEAIALASVVGLRLSVILLLAVVWLRLLPVIGLSVIALPVSALAIIRLLLAVDGRRLGRQLLAVVRLLLAVTGRWWRAVTWLLLLAITRRRLLVVARLRLRRIDGFVVREARTRHWSVIAARGAAVDGDAGISHAFRLHQVEQHGGISRRQPHAAVRHRQPQMLDVEEAVDGVAVQVEE